MNFQNLTFPIGRCARTHDFELDDKGHQCRRCGLREEIIHGQKFVIDPFMPEGEVRLEQDGLTVGRITGLHRETPIGQGFGPVPAQPELKKSSTECANRPVKTK